MKIHSGEQTLESMKLAKWYNNWLIDKFKNYLTGDILEVGCGIGNFTTQLARYGKVWAVDVDKKYLKYKLNFNNKNIVIGFGDIERGKFFFKNKKFNTVFCLNVIEHTLDDKQAFKNIYQLLLPSGILCLVVPSSPRLYGEIDRSIGHFRRYQKDELLINLQRQGFKIIQTRRINFIGGIGWFIASNILNQKTVKKNQIKLFNILAPLLLQAERFFEPPIGTSILVIAQK